MLKAERLSLHNDVHTTLSQLDQSRTSLDKSTLKNKIKTFQDKDINTRIIYTYVVTVYVYTLSHHDNIILLTYIFLSIMLFITYFIEITPNLHV